MNRAIIVGNLGQDPELRTTAGGTAVCSLRIATNERRKDRDGEWQDHTEWHDVVVWAGQAEAVAKHCAKGTKVAVEGRLQTRKWEDRDGNDRYTTEIVAERVDFMSTGDSNGSRGGGRDEGRGGGRGGRGGGGRGRGRDDDRGGRGGGGRGRGRDDDRGGRGGRDRDDWGGRDEEPY